MNTGLIVGLEQDSSSTLHSLLTTTATGVALDVIGFDGEGEGLEAWRRFVVVLSGADLIQKLLAFDIHEEVRAGDAVVAGRHVAAPVDHAGHRQSREAAGGAAPMQIGAVKGQG